MRRRRPGGGLARSGPVPYLPGMDFPAHVLDGHIHIMKPETDPSGLLAGMSAAGIQGGDSALLPAPLVQVIPRAA